MNTRKSFGRRNCAVNAYVRALSAVSCFASRYVRIVVNEGPARCHALFIKPLTLGSPVLT